MKASAIILASTLAALTATASSAQDESKFYDGKQIRMIIRSGVGGGYDLYSRMLARHIGKHIPGNPSVMPINMPGGGGITAANYVATVAPRDGTILTMVSQGLPTDQALGLTPSFKADLRTFNWIGNMSSSNQVTVVWHTSKTQSFEEAKKRETTIGSTGAGSVSTQLPALFNNLLGTKFKIIVGYPDGREVDMAMERGEVEGRGTNPWASYKSAQPRLVKEKLIRPIIQIGLEKEPDLPDVPLLLDQPVAPEDKPILEFMSKAVMVGRPIGSTPGVPPARVNVLRRAFDATLKDPEFIAEAKAQNAEIDYMSGEALAKIIDDLLSAPPSVHERVKAVLRPRDSDMAKSVSGK
ncbi:MAG: Bug family tripartite tricarboxylate transporter substrate binding protein [Beijerinckiaceae bacterium]